jgi:hypothetical protein
LQLRPYCLSIALVWPRLTIRTLNLPPRFPDDMATLPLTAEERQSIAARASEQEGDLIGPYKLLQQIGEGGFGSVWMAEQSKPISRKVALKVIKAGMDARDDGSPEHRQGPRRGRDRQGAAVLCHGAGQGHAHHAILR